MTSEEFQAARKKLGLSVNEMADALRLSPENGGRKVRRFESGGVKISGPVAVAVEAMLSGFVPEQAPTQGEQSWS